MGTEITEIATMSSKGQLTVPAIIRKIMGLQTGSTVLFKATEKGVSLVPCEIKEKTAYTQEEWGKIERLVAERGKKYRSARGAKRHLDSL